jgi:hypothetical protein
MKRESRLDSAARSRTILSTLIATLLLTVVSCGSSGPPTDRRVGDLSDRTWGGLLGKPPRTSASGKPVHMEQFKGRFIWADYAAPWCSTCSKQRSVLSRLEHSLGTEIVFLTVMTSGPDGYGDPATRATAQAWSDQQGAHPDRVVAANLTSMTIPRHVLFSPEGQMLFEHTGFMPEDAIRRTLERHRSEWRASRAQGLPPTT